MLLMKLVKEIDETKEVLTRMTELVREAINLAIESLNEQDVEKAEKVIKGDDEIDKLEVEIEKRCIRMVALYQPEASDLRFIMGIYKIVSDLERMGDEAENIAERSLLLAKEPPLKPYVNLTLMAQIVKEMVQLSVLSFINRDTHMAKVVIQKDDLVDELYHQLERELITYVMEDIRNIRKVINLSFVARHLERIADHSENIAEMVIYWVEGEMVKHKHIKDEG